MCFISNFIFKIFQFQVRDGENIAATQKFFEIKWKFLALEKGRNKNFIFLAGKRNIQKVLFIHLWQSWIWLAVAQDRGVSYGERKLQVTDLKIDM